MSPAEPPSLTPPMVAGGLKMKNPSRPEWDEYFLCLADLAATRSTCLRRQVGALLVADNRALATGYNGAPQGMAHCLELGCLREKLKIPSGQRHEMCRAIHAEQNAIIQAAKHGIATRNATLYCTTQPCIICAKMLINLEVNRMVFRHSYPDELSQAILVEAGYTLADSESYLVWSHP